MPKSNFESNRPENSKRKKDSCTSIISKASRILSSCRICLSSLLDPASLTCGYKFCEDCLQKYWHVAEKPEDIVCPLCRTAAVSINFSKNEDKPITHEFRKTFEIMDNVTPSKSPIDETMLRYLKIVILLMPLVYFVSVLLKNVCYRYVGIIEI